MIVLRPWIDRLLEKTLISLMAILTVDVLWQVAARYLLAQPSSWTEELARFLLIWITLLGAAYLTGLRGHIAIEILMPRLDPPARVRLDRLVRAVVWLFALGVLVIGGFNLMYVTLTLGQESPALHVPLGYVYAVLPISGLLIMYYCVAGARTFVDNDTAAGE